MKVEKAIFAAGCFWGVQHQFERIPGVLNTTVGYTGGPEANPTYTQVKAHMTHHVEAIFVDYDADMVSYVDLCKLFFEIHDPSQTDGIGPDLGPQYRSMIFYMDEKQKSEAEEVIELLRSKGHRKKGEIVGVIGRNGSGKSTLLKAIAGIFAPDQGTITLATPSVSLLSIGVGFQRKLTGRENVMLSGMLLGFSEQQILEKMDEIIEFAEIGSFIDRPVKTYSSGMFSKLAFSITAVLETDIMLIDEILSVGDTKFKKKSYEKMKELIFDKNRTVMIVSHNPDTVRQLCTSVLWIHEGKVRMQGDVETVLEAYEGEA